MKEVLYFYFLFDYNRMILIILVTEKENPIGLIAIHETP